MAGQKFVNLQSGILKEVVTVQTGGTGSENLIPSLDAAGKLDVSMMPTGVAPDVEVVTASEALSASNPFVYIKSDGQVANASGAVSGNPCVGFITASYASGATDVKVYFEGRVTGLTELTVGARYYLSDTTAGSITATPVSGAGKLHQYIGRAVTATTISFEADDHIVLA